MNGRPIWLMVSTLAVLTVCVPDANAFGRRCSGHTTYYATPCYVYSQPSYTHCYTPCYPWLGIVGMPQTTDGDSVSKPEKPNLEKVPDPLPELKPFPNK